jgi:glycosyltransferase involved in cell wall biosynthesis
LPRQISVIRNGIDLELFQSVPLSKNGDVQILGVGSLLQIKRWDRLLDAASKLKTRGLQFRVKICGSGPLRPWLEGRARELRVTDRVEILGHSDQIPDMLASATLLAHTSDVEGCPNVVMEAMACGRAVVATDVGDVSSLVEDGKTGFVVGCGDNEALLDRLAKLINDRDLCRTMGEAARAKAVREFGAERLVAETFTAYKMAGWGDS